MKWLFGSGKQNNNSKKISCEIAGVCKKKNATLDFFVTHCDILAEAAAFAVGAK